MGEIRAFSEHEGASQQEQSLFSMSLKLNQGHVISKLKP